MIRPVYQVNNRNLLNGIWAYIIFISALVFIAIPAVSYGWGLFGEAIAACGVFFPLGAAIWQIADLQHNRRREPLMVTQTRLFGFVGVIVMLLAGCAGSPNRGIDPCQENETSTPTAAQVDEDRSGCVVSSVPHELGFDPFYMKYCDADGIPIISSGEVDDLALMQAHYLIKHMLAPIPDVRQELITNRAYFGIIGENEMQTTLPEYSHLDSQYWDRRARGLGASRDSPITSAAEENLLCLPRDRYRGESIAVHEFAHTIALLGFGDKRDALEQELGRLYDTALQEGLWNNTYAASDVQEYWAEGVQSYFNTNLEAEPPDGVHNHVDTREELTEYDPQLHEFISRIFKGYRWTADCPPQG